MKHELRHGERLVALCAKRNEILPADACNMRIGGFLFGDRTFPTRRSAIRLVVMAGKEPRLIRQGQNILNGVPEGIRIPAGKSARAEPLSGMNSVSWMKAASPMT